MSRGLSKIRAIKALRELTSMSLREAKDAVELVDRYLHTGDLFDAAMQAHRALLERIPGSVPGGEDVCEALRLAIMKADEDAFTPPAQYATVNVVVLGHEIPIEVEYTGIKTGDELYELAKAQLRELL